MSSTVQVRRRPPLWVVAGLVLLVAAVVVGLGYLANFVQKGNILGKADKVIQDAQSGKRSVANLDEAIQHTEALKEEYPNDHDVLHTLARLYRERASGYYQSNQYDKAAEDFATGAEYYKRIDHTEGYAALRLRRAMMLEEAGRWQEAMDTCDSLVTEVGPEKATYRTYELLLRLTKKAPDPTKRDPVKMDEYRRRIMEMTRGDWVEKD